MTADKCLFSIFHWMSHLRAQTLLDVSLLVEVVEMFRQTISHNVFLTSEII
jgi:hypothetical protein